MPGACAAPSCKYDTRKLHVFRFPRDVRRCNQWLINCSRQDLMDKSPKYLNTHCRLCEKHFEDDQFMNASKSRLMWKAVPTIFDSSDPPEAEKRRKFKHSFLSTKRKRTPTLDQSCSSDHTYFAALDKLERTKEAKAIVLQTRTYHDVTVSDMSQNMTSVLLDTRSKSNFANFHESCVDKTEAVNTEASDVAGSFDESSETESLSSRDPYIANLIFKKTSGDIKFLTDGIVCANSDVVGEFNVNTDAIMIYTTSIRDETIQDDGGWTANMNFEDSFNTNAPVLEFQEELEDGTSEGNMIANSGIRECSTSATTSLRKIKRRKVAASGSVDHTYATSILRKSCRGESDCSCETFSKEQGMMLVKKILSMQRKEASVSEKRSKTKTENPTVESVVEGAVQLGMKDSTSQFFASQLRNCVRNNKGHRWSALDKTFARDLFVKSKEAYKVLEDFFHLPSAATLQRHARGLNTTGSCFEHSGEA